jgi:hypothetical protein
MKKLSDLHSQNSQKQTPQGVSTSTDFAAPAVNTTKPKGVMDHAHPGHVSRGAAESKSNPIRDEHEGADSARKPRH